MDCRHSLFLSAFAIFAPVLTQVASSDEPAFAVPSFPVQTPSPSDAVSLIRLEALDAAALYPPVVTALATAHENQWLIAAGDDHALRVVNLGSGRILQTLSGHTDWVQAIVVDDKEPSILSCSKDGTLLAWKESDGWKPKAVHRGPNALMGMAVAVEQRLVAVSGFESDIYIYSLDDHALIQTLRCECGDTRTLAFSNDGNQLACGGRDGVLRVWDWRSGGQPLEQPLHRDRIRAVQFSLDGSEVTTIGEDRRVVRYRHRVGQVVSDREIKSGRLLSMTFIDDTTLAIAGSDNTIRTIDTTTGNETSRLVGHEGSVAVMTMSRNQLVSAGFDTTIRLWELERIQQVRQTKESKYFHPVSSRFQDSGVGEGVK